MPTMDVIRSVLQRHTPHVVPRSAELKVAAVAAVFRQRADDVEVLMIHRAEDPRDPWSGHMAFPGGRVEGGDQDPPAAAVRETREEVGLDLETNGILLGRLSDVAAVGRGRPMSLVIEPFVYSVDIWPDLKPNHEVAEITLRVIIVDRDSGVIEEHREWPLLSVEISEGLERLLDFGIHNSILG